MWCLYLDGFILGECSFVHGVVASFDAQNDFGPLDSLLICLFLWCHMEDFGSDGANVKPIEQVCVLLVLPPK